MKFTIIAATVGLSLFGGAMALPAYETLDRPTLAQVDFCQDLAKEFYPNKFTKDDIRCVCECGGGGCNVPKGFDPQYNIIVPKRCQAAIARIVTSQQPEFGMEPKNYQHDSAEIFGDVATEENDDVKVASVNQPVIPGAWSGFFKD